MRRDEAAELVKKADWYRSGYDDGRNGNPKWPPADKDARAQYLVGYLKGKIALREMEK